MLDGQVLQILPHEVDHSSLHPSEVSLPDLRVWTSRSMPMTLQCRQRLIPGEGDGTLDVLPEDSPGGYVDSPVVVCNPSWYAEFWGRKQDQSVADKQQAKHAPIAVQIGPHKWTREQG